MISIRPEAHRTKSHQIGMNQTNSNRLQSNQRMSNKKEPHGINPNRITSNWIGPFWSEWNQHDSIWIKPKQTASVTTESNRWHSTQIELNQRESNRVKPRLNQTKLNQLWQTPIESDQIKIGSSRVDNQNAATKITLNWPESKRIKLNQI